MTSDDGVRSRWWQEWGALCLIGLLALPLFTPRVYASDEIKYFATLRSVYFDRDLHYENEYGYFIDRDPVAHAGLTGFRDGVTPTGYRLNDAPIGTSLLWAPFYVAADIGVAIGRALGAEVPRDGFSWPYRWAVSVASLFWGMIGLALTYRLCRHHAPRASATWAVFAVWLASPVVFYLYITPAMSHASSLFAVSLYLLVWYGGRGRRTVSGWVGLGLAAGLMVLVRELNWLFLMVPAADELVDIVLALRSEAGRPRPAAQWLAVLRVLVRERGPRYLGFAMAVAVVVAPQFYVYRVLNGTFGPTPFVVEKFSILPLHALDVLLSGFHGLFSWHPVTLVGVLGLAALWRQKPRVAGVLALVFVAQVLVIGSYDTWAGGASFGARRFVNCTPIFALGIAAALARLDAPRRRLAAIGLVLLTVWNAGLAIQYSTGLIPRDAPVTMWQIAHNQLFEVPPRVANVAQRFLFDRSSFYRTRS